MKRTHALVSIGSLLLLLAFVSAAFATQISYTGYLPAPPVGSRTNWYRSVELQQFDPSLGTLNFVRVTLSQSLSGMISFENMSTSDAVASAELMSVMGLYSDYSSGVFSGLLASTTSTISTPTTTIAGAPAGGVSTTLPSPTYASGPGFFNSGLLASTSSQTATPSDFSSWIGTGTVTYWGRARGMSGFEGGDNSGNVIFTSDAWADGAATVVYDYNGTDVPEWNTLALASLGAFAGLPFLRRRLR